MSSEDNIDNSINTNAPSVVMVESSRHLTAMIVICSLAAALSSYSLATSKQAQQDAWNAQTDALFYKDQVEKLRFELASHGIIPPAVVQSTR